MNNVQEQTIDYLKKWRHWHYENTALLIVSIIAFAFLTQTEIVDKLIQQIGNLGYLGSFIVGIFFVSTFTVAPAAIILFNLAERLNLVGVAVLAGLGAMLGDYVIFHFMRDRVFEELRPLFHKLNSPKIKIIYKSPYFAWLLPLFGAFIIASPFPDEVGIGMLGLARIRKWQFFLLAFVLNGVGILVTIALSRAV